MEPQGKLFKEEGFQLMNIMMKGKKLSRFGALKLLSYCLNSDVPEIGVYCNAFVEMLGLCVIFPLLMKTPSLRHKQQGIVPADSYSQSQLHEYIMTVVNSLIKNCTLVAKERVLLKFSENHNYKRYHLVRKIIDDEKADRMYQAEDNDEYLLKELDAGLYILFLIDETLMICIEKCDDSVINNLKTVLNVKRVDIQEVIGVVRRYVQYKSPGFTHAIKDIEKLIARCEEIFKD
ncbi:hypothetical protein ACOME3_002680 [Neoechinorhynchus agilis]